LIIPEVLELVDAPDQVKFVEALVTRKGAQLAPLIVKFLFVELEEPVYSK
jgi:hypothetical protein